MNHIIGGSKAKDKAKDMADGFCTAIGIPGLVVPNPVSLACLGYGVGRLLDWW